MCIRKDSTGKLWLQLSLTRSESWVQFRIHLAARRTARAIFLLPRFPTPDQGMKVVGRVLGLSFQWNAYSSNRMVQMPMTPPRMRESRRFLRLILCIRLFTAGKRLAKVFILL